MTRPCEIELVLAQLQVAFGPIDVLANNVGIEHVVQVDEFSADDVGCNHVDQPHLCIPHSLFGIVRHESKRSGQHHQSGIGPRVYDTKAE